MTDRQQQLAADAAARARALEVASFIVEAPAGAGKTELLTQRFLRLLAVVDNPEEVVALTFTNKAATEMRDRILGSLERAAGGERPGDDAPHKQVTFDLGRAVLERDAERDWQILAHPGRLAVTTIDALCAGLARQMPYLSRFGSQPGIADQPDEHYRAAARQTIELLEAGGPDAEVVAAALAFLDNDAGRLERLLVAMLEKRDQWLHHSGRGAGADLRAEAECALGALVERDLAAAARALAPREQEALMSAARFAAANLAFDNPDSPICRLEHWSEPLTGELSELDLWRSLADFLLTGTGTLRKTYNKNQGIPATPEGKLIKTALAEALGSLPGAAERALARIRRLPDPEYGDEEWATVATFSRLLLLAAARLWLVFQEAGEVDFIAIAQSAVEALGSDEAPTDLALALDYRIRHLLVDEFQDTSPAQVELIAGLTRGWENGDGRTLFLVGDPMQSIYRFRKADVGLFLEVRDAGIGPLSLEKLRLYRNNRSAPAVVDWVNAVFPGVFPAADDPLAGAVAFAEAAATKPEDEGAGVFVHPVLVGDGDEGARLEAARMLTLIREASAARPEESIAVLVRAKSHLAALVAEIRRNAPELRFQAVEIEALEGRQAVQDVISLCHALSHLADRVHWLAILRAPWCGLTLADLHALAGDDFETNVWTLMQDEARRQRLSEDGRRRLERTAAILGEALAERGRSHPRRWIEGTWRLLGGPACLSSAGDHGDVAALFQLMDRLSARGRLDPAVLEMEAAELFAPPDPLATEALQMMTIHKSKGLEFDTVILPGLDRRKRPDDPPLLVWDELPVAGRECLVVAPMKQKGNGSGKPTAYDALRWLEAERSAHEDERVLYVAVTRARRALHLVGVAALDGEAAKAPAAGTPLCLLWHSVGDIYAEAAARHEAVAAAPAGPDPATFVPDLLRLPTAALPALPPRPSLGAAESAVAAEGEDEDKGLSLATAVGTLAHRYLEMAARQGLEHWPAERMAGLVQPCRLWLRSQGHGEAMATAGAERVVRILAGVLASDIGRWVLGSRPDAGAELALSSRSDGSVAHHVVDRTFVEDGCRWIIDYKTVGCDQADPAAFLRERAESYRPQLERYAGLFAAAGQPLRLAIFFIEQGRLVELENR